jgi:hypothetical protein
MLGYRSHSAPPPQAGEDNGSLPSSYPPPYTGEVDRAKRETEGGTCLDSIWALGYILP